MWQPSAWQPEDMQQWALALLLSVQPTDRALAGWDLAGAGRSTLTRLAAGDDTIARHADG